MKFQSLFCGCPNLDTEYELKFLDTNIDMKNQDNLSLELKVKVININSKAVNQIFL